MTSVIQYALYRVRGDRFDFQQVSVKGYICNLLNHDNLIAHLPMEHEIGIIRKVMMEELLTGHLL